MKGVSENAVQAVATYGERTGIVPRSLSSLTPLLTKLAANKQLTTDDLAPLKALDLKRICDDPKSHGVLLTCLIRLLKHDNKQEPLLIDGELLRSLLNNDSLLEGVKWGEEDLIAVAAKLKNGSSRGNAAELLNKIADKQPLPSSVRLILSNNISSKSNAEYNKNAIKSLNKSLLLCNELISDSVVSNLSSYVVSKNQSPEKCALQNYSQTLYPEKAQARLDAMELLLREGKFTDEQFKYLQNLRGYNNKNTEVLNKQIHNKAVKLIEEYEYGYSKKKLRGIFLRRELRDGSNKIATRTKTVARYLELL